ncbi:MAG: two-component system, chemotaxis family, response regulator CheY [Elusimicrobia bacterium]|nr:MAG: two-component system, chemotaxis family, response regulator CheY [Elusimicrobiota bacterium]
MARILVVDDNEVIRGMLRFLLMRLGHTVVAEAATGAAALEAFRRERPDAVSLDISLPDMSGLEVLKVIAAESPGALVVVVTGNNAEVLRRDVLAAGARAVLLKPFDVKALQRVFGGEPGAK